ncbi:MAG TPA: PfkB family carbohydrate kinase, partial [Dongiaceae bacterium]
KAAAEIAATGKTTVIVTLGGDGAVAYGTGKTLTAGVLPITPIDTVAAGDAFVGGFAASVDRRGDLQAALAYGSVAGGLACLCPGAQPALPMKVAIDKALKSLPPIKVG